MQQDLASLSVDYVKNESKLLPPTNPLENYIFPDDRGRLCAPVYYCMQILIQRIISKQQYLLINLTRWTKSKLAIENIKLLYIGDHKTQTFRLVSPDECLTPLNAIVLCGHNQREDQEQLSTDDFLNIFNSYSLKEIIMACSAQHAQFPEQMNSKYALPVDPEKELLSKKAEVMGCTPNNLSLFLINHIYVKKIDNLLDHNNHNNVLNLK